jgi:hypothetical protein
MIMATISENLQILKDSTDAIKQAIIDKGSTIEGDITTWASAINGISGGESTEEEITFRGTLTLNKTKIIIGGTLDSKPQHDSSLYFCAFGFTMDGIICKSQSIVMTNTINITLDMGEPIGNVGNTNFLIIGSNYSGRCPIWKVNFIENTSQGGNSGGSTN